MTKSTQKRNNMVGFLVVIAASAVTMLWLLWHHPVPTAIVTIVVLAAFAISARLAQMVDTDVSDRDQRNRAGLR